MFRWMIALASSCLLSLSPTPSRGDNGWQGQSLSLFWENDAIAGKDRHYTQGAGISYLSRDNAVPSWLVRASDWIPSGDLNVSARKIGFDAIQEIYTPEDLAATGVVTEDQPYAGWLFGRATLQRRGVGLGGLLGKETFWIDVGIVGRESLAERTQKTWHGSPPQGWKHQLDTEPGLVLGYSRHYLVRFQNQTGTWGTDLIPLLHAEVGNVSTLAKVGLTSRLGYNIPNDFETLPSHRPLRYGWYFRAGFDGRYVARNLFLDGNTFESSHQVEKNHWIGSYHIGLTVVLKRIEIDVAQTFRTREFEFQNSSDSVGRATVTLKF